MKSDMRLQATAPDANVWVSAHAGAGKTHMLTQRLLRLLVEGVNPASILCLTYTNAAAAEMRERLTKEVGRFATLPEAECTTRLSDILGRTPSASTLAHARGLFATLVDHDHTPRIETLHAFCHMLLRKFPLEAGVFPNFTLVEDAAALVCKREVSAQVLRTAPLGALPTRYSDATLTDLAEDVLKHEHRWRDFFARAGGVEAACAVMQKALGLAENTATPAADEEGLHAACEALLASDKKTDHALAEALRRRKDNMEYCSAWVTKEGELKKAPFTKAITGAAREALEAEAQRALVLLHRLCAEEVYRCNVDVYRLAQPLIAAYRATKDAQGLLDFNDVIAYTKRLLVSPESLPWVLYRMDAQIEHFLIDEAQDTSPEQWEIVEALTADHFAGESAHEAPRSLFVVGDFKQSIYRFQGADVAQFQTMQQRFKAKTEAVRKSMMEVTLNTSYRSTSAVLAAVDAVCKPADEEAQHHCHRVGQAGRVEVWPLIAAEEDEGAEARACVQVVDTVCGWLEEKRLLPAKGREMRPSDVMILLRQRGTLAGALTNAFKRRGVPVSGPDRMLLREHIAVEDVLALLQFLNLPQDDYALACALKSPLFNVSEDALYNYAQGREGSLYTSLATHNAALHKTLHELLNQVDNVSPFALVHGVLNEAARARFVARLGVEVLGVLDYFLSAVQQYEALETPSLQGLLAWMERTPLLLHSSAAAAHAVNIMTVHGAKGLQAPVVMVVGAASVPRTEDRIGWAEVPLVMPAKSAVSPALKAIRARSRREVMEEYYRLLYVAITRAEDELYVIGHGKSSPDECWLSVMEHAVAPMAEAVETPAGKGYAITSQQIEPVTLHLPEALEIEVPRPVFAPLPAHQALDVLTPSALEERTASPLDTQTYTGFGEMVHLLLQHGVTDARGAHTLLARHFPSADYAQALEQACGLLAREDLAWIWREALREAPIAGEIEWEGRTRLVEGRVDALVVRETECIIIDFKTHAHTPTNMPEAIRKQMQMYAAVMQHVYPDKAIRTLILWTSTGELVAA